MSLVDRVVHAFRSVAIVIAIAVVFLFGVATTVYLSLRSPEVKVPHVVGKDRFEAEKILTEADLKFRVRAWRPSNQAKDTVVFQLPRPGEVVKAGQTVAMDISRETKEGETPETVTPAENTNENRNANTTVNANANKPRKPRNRNANDNANDNGNANKAANANRTNTNAAGNVNASRPNVNRPGVPNINSRPNSNLNDNRRPVAPRPTPAVPKPTRQP